MAIECNQLSTIAGQLQERFEKCKVLKAEDMDLLVDLVVAARECSEGNVLQDNLIKSLDLGSVANELELITTFNSTSEFSVLATEILIVEANVGGIQKKYILNSGKGSYGSGSGRTISSSDLELIFSDISNPQDFDSVTNQGNVTDNPITVDSLTITDQVGNSNTSTLKRESGATRIYDDQNGSFLGVQDDSLEFGHGGTLSRFDFNFVTFGRVISVPNRDGVLTYAATDGTNTVQTTNDGVLDLSQLNFAFNQDNITVTTSLGNSDSISDTANLINNLPSFTVEENEVRYFEVIEDFRPRLYKLKLGKGTYGIGNTPVTQNDLQLIRKSFSVGNTDDINFANGVLILNEDVNHIGAYEGELQFITNPNGNVALRLDSAIKNQIDNNSNLTAISNGQIPFGNSTNNGIISSSDFRYNSSTRTMLLDSNSINFRFSFDGGAGVLEYDGPTSRLTYNEAFTADSISIIGGTGDNLLLDDGTTIALSSFDDGLLSLSSANTGNITAQTGHVGGMNDYDSALDGVLTIPDFATSNIPVGTILTYQQINTGNLSVSYSGAASGDSAQTYKQGDTLSLWHKSLDNWVVLNPPRAIDSTTQGEPSGSDQVLNIVTLTQAEYDAGSPLTDTVYIIKP